MTYRIGEKLVICYMRLTVVNDIFEGKAPCYKVVGCTSCKLWYSKSCDCIIYDIIGDDRLIYTDIDISDKIRLKKYESKKI